jgi:Tfp pilus assembly protein FimT
MAAPTLLNAAMVQRRRSNQGGWSLMETLVVFGVIGIMAAVAFPRFRGMTGPYATRAAASQLAAEFAAARLRAISTNCSVRVTYTSSNSTYQVQRQVGGNWTTERQGQLPMNVTVTYTDANSPPTFNGRGLPSAAVNIPMVYSDGGHQRTVGINALGKVTIS